MTLTADQTQEVLRIYHDRCGQGFVPDAALDATMYATGLPRIEIEKVIAGQPEPTPVQSSIQQEPEPEFEIGGRAGNVERVERNCQEPMSDTANVQQAEPAPVVTAPVTIPQPDAKGEFASPVDGALWMAMTWGIPQTPLRGKVPFLPEWQKRASTDPEQIRKWAAEYSRTNFGSVALPGGIFIFEVDKPEVLKRFSTFASRLIIQSGPGRGHRYYKQVPGLENISQDNLHGDFSLRVNGEQCVSPGSVHPERKTQYRVKVCTGLVEPTAAEIAFWNSEKKQKAFSPTAADDGDSPFPEGSRNASLTSLLGRARQVMRMDAEQLYQYGLDLNQKRCVPPLPDSEVKTIADSVGRYPITSIEVLHAGVPVGPIPQNGQAAVVIETEPIVTKESLPEFPKMSGVLWDMAVSMYPDIPVEFKFMALVTHWGLIRSGIDVLDGEAHYQPRFFTCFVADPGRGKSAAIGEVRRIMEAIKPPTMWIADSVDSGPALVDDFADLQKQHPSANAVQVLIEADEQTDLFEKSKITAQSRNSLSTMLLSLFERNIASNRARSANKGKRTQVENAHLAILGGTTFLGAETMWNKIGGGANGLQSRFVPIVTTQGALGRATRTPSYADALNTALMRLIKLNELPGQTVYLDAEAQQELNDWWAKYSPWDKASVRRIDDIVKRMIIVLAVTNIDPNDREPIDDNCVVVGRDIVVQATAFGDYVIMVRERVNPVDSYSWTQAFEASIQAVFEKSPKKMFSKRDVRRAVNADHKPGGYQSFGQAWDTIVKPDLGIVDLIGNNHKGAPVYRLVVD